MKDINPVCENCMFWFGIEYPNPRHGYCEANPPSDPKLTSLEHSCPKTDPKRTCRFFKPRPYNWDVYGNR